MDSPQRERTRLIYPAGQAEPLDFLRFVQLGTFESDWKRLALDDDDLRALEVLVMIHPTKPPVGLRKG